jgi:hypothetical protein
MTKCEMQSYTRSAAPSCCCCTLLSFFFFFFFRCTKITTVKKYSSFAEKLLAHTAIRIMPQIASLFFSDLEKKEKQHEGERECVCVEGRQGASKQARASSSSSSSSSSRRGKKARAFVLAKGK